MNITIPQDPAMLLSFLNLKLRDYYASLDALCEDLGLDKAALTEKLRMIDYEYSPEHNQFV